MSIQFQNNNAPPLSDEDREILEMIHKANEQFDEFIDATSFGLRELLVDSDASAEIPGYTWDAPLTLTIKTS